ncbi:MAG: hypothetical protein HZA54_01820 [Planctomycetes bacterium]|nr:hypothetical protein [Planctomycetota bacterium]
MTDTVPTVGCARQAARATGGRSLRRASAAAAGCDLGLPVPQPPAVLSPPGEFKFRDTVRALSPEQAAGRIGAIGPATDIWSLGVILYEHLAGRKPSDGEGIIKILQAIQGLEPPPPAPAPAPGNSVGGVRAARRVHPDLATIALKCLEKEPARRYPTAAALADDLGRFLDGEPILARPVSAGRRLARRAWRRRLIVLPTSVAGLLKAVRGRRTPATPLAHPKGTAYNEVSRVANAPTE